MCKNAFSSKKVKEWIARRSQYSSKRRFPPAFGDGFTGLREQVENLPDVLQLLCSLEANVDLRDDSGRTGADYARAAGLALGKGL